MGDKEGKGIAFVNNSPFAKLKSVPISAVKMDEGFWKTRMKNNVEKGIPSIYGFLKKEGILNNFIRIYKTGYQERTEHTGHTDADASVYKLIEAASFVLQSADNPKIKNMLDEVINIIIPAQDEDGYINTFTYSIERQSKEKFIGLRDYQELFSAGHLFQAAVAHHRATGEKRLLNCAIKFADYLYRMFNSNKKTGWGANYHPQIEMSLVELYRETKDKKYLELSEFFLNHIGFGSLREIMGHAVQATYLTSGGADYYIETGKKDFWDSLSSQWKSMVKTKSYITGGIGSRYQVEAFGAPYELPNEGAYGETCASIGSIYWNWRMLLITGNSSFSDVMERTLYNGFLSGISLGGDKFFYANPLLFSPMSLFANHTSQPWNKERNGLRMHYGGTRQSWYRCPCCLSNSIRMIASIPGYFFSTSKEGIWVHLYDNCSLNWHLADGTNFILSQKSKYPWEGRIEMKISVEKEKRFSLFLRVPSWCKEMQVLVNDEKVPLKLANGYVQVSRVWKETDKLTLDLEMKVNIMSANKRVAEDRGKVALQRGPIVYCFEEADNPHISILEAALNIDRDKKSMVNLEERYHDELLGGVVSLKASGVIPDSSELNAPLYRTFEQEQHLRDKDVLLTAIPYYAWANRKLSEMTVWIPTGGVV